MNKSDLVAAIAGGSGLTKADAARALSATTNAISSALAGGDTVAITGFGVGGRAVIWRGTECWTGGFTAIPLE